MKKQLELTENQIEKLSAFLVNKFQKEEKTRKYAKVKLILSLLGKGLLLASAFIAPGAARLTKGIFEEEKYWEVWKQYNLTYLRQTIKRLHQQKLVEIYEHNGQKIIRLSKNGRQRILKYALEEMGIKRPKNWDGKWRLVIYDIPSKKRRLQNLIRETLKRLGFLELQESVYLIPFPCFEEIQFLREYYYLDENIKMLIVAHLEDEKAYQTYFGI